MRQISSASKPLSTTFVGSGLILALRPSSLVSAFERAWKEGNGAALVDVLAEWPEDERTQVLEELLPIELQHRRRRGETPSLVDYGRRFPVLSATLAGLFPSPRFASPTGVVPVMSLSRNRSNSGRHGTPGGHHVQKCHLFR